MIKKITLIFLCIATSSILAVSQDNSYSFFIAGHVYGEQGVDNVALHPPFKEKFAYIQSREDIKMGIFLGDVVYSPSPEDWDEVDADIDTLGLPVYITPGNHDLINRELFEERYGITYSSFIYQNDLFILLDPLLDEWNISGAQYDFFLQTIENQAQFTNNIFILFHQLLWYETDNIYSVCQPNGLNGRAETINFWEEIIPICKSLDNRVVFCAGDVGANQWAGIFMYDNFDNISFIATGMGYGINDNFIIVNISAEKEISYELICLNEEDLNCFGDLEDYEISSVDSNVVTESISCFPNPTNSILTLTGLNHDNFRIEIFSSDGQIIHSTEVNNNSVFQMNCSHLPNGVYFIRLNSSQKSESLIFVKI